VHRDRAHTRRFGGVAEREAACPAAVGLEDLHPPRTGHIDSSVRRDRQAFGPVPCPPLPHGLASGREHPNVAVTEGDHLVGVVHGDIQQGFAKADKALPAIVAARAYWRSSGTAMPGPAPGR